MLCCVLNPDPGSASNERVKVPFTSCQAFLPPEAHPIFPRLGGRCDGRFSACDLPACELSSQITQLPWHLDPVPRALPRDHPAVWACEGFGSSRRLPGPPTPAERERELPQPTPHWGPPAGKSKLLRLSQTHTPFSGVGNPDFKRTCGYCVAQGFSTFRIPGLWRGY